MPRCESDGSTGLELSGTNCIVSRASSVPRDLWVGDVAGQVRPESAEAVKDMYVVPAFKCGVLKTAKGVHRPPSHVDVHDDDDNDDERNAIAHRTPPLRVREVATPEQIVRKT